MCAGATLKIYRKSKDTDVAAMQLPLWNFLEMLCIDLEAWSTRLFHFIQTPASEQL